MRSGLKASRFLHTKGSQIKGKFGFLFGCHSSFCQLLGGSENLVSSY